MTNINSAFYNYDETVEKSKTSYSGLLGLAINGNRIVNHPTRAGYVYVRLRDNLSEVVQAFNDKVSPVYDFPVLIQRKGNRWYVLGRDDLRYESWGTSAPYLPRHGDQHSFNRDGGGGGDVTWVYPDQFMPLLVYPSGTYGASNLLVAPYVLQKSDKFIYVGNTGTANIVRYKPTNSSAIMGLVYLDRDTGNPGFLINSGTTFSGAITGTNAVVPYLPYPSSTQEPLYAFRLVSGTTSLTWSNLYNVRQFIGGSTSTGTSSGVSDHESLTGLLGGSANNHYHLTPSQVIGLVSGTSSVLHSHSGTYPYTDTKEPTGWIDPSNVTVSYDSTARTITLTPVSGTLQYLWRGVKYDLGTTWTSSAHTATNGGWYLSSSNGVNFTWSMTAWTFDVLMVSFVSYGATYKFAFREAHGLMQWQTHEELHSTIGTYKESGGTLSNYTLRSTTAANRRPDVAATILHDEDIETTNAALTSKLYNKMYLAGSTPTVTYTTGTADIVPLLVNNPYYNSYTAPNWGQTLMSNNSYMSVWLVAMPTTSDTTSQQYRYTWIQGQSNTNLAGQTALTPSDLNLASFTPLASEFVFLAKIIIRYTGGNWDLYSVTNLTGNRLIQVGSPAGAYLSSVAHNATLDGDGSLTSPLGVVSGTLIPYNFVTGSIAFADSAGFLIEDNKHLRYNSTLRSVRMGKDATFNNFADQFPFFATAEFAGESIVNGVYAYGTGTSGLPLPGFGMYRSRGTPEVPTSVKKDDVLGSIFGAGHDGENFYNGGRIRFYADVDWTTGANRASRTAFLVTPSGTTTQIEKMVLYGDSLNLINTGTYNSNGIPILTTFLATANTFTANQKIAGAVDPKLILNEGNTGASLFEIVDTSSAIGSIRKTAASGAALIDIDPLPSDGISAASFRFFRSTDTTGRVSFDVFKGKASADINCSLAGNGNSYVQLQTGSFGLGTNTYGTNAESVFAIFNGVEPTTSPADTLQLFAVDLSAGNSTLGMRTETAVVTETVISDRTLSVRINGATYKICLKA